MSRYQQIIKQLYKQLKKDTDIISIPLQLNILPPDYINTPIIPVECAGFLTCHLPLLHALIRDYNISGIRKLIKLFPNELTIKRKYTFLKDGAPYFSLKGSNALDLLRAQKKEIEMERIMSVNLKDAQDILVNKYQQTSSDKLATQRLQNIDRIEQLLQNIVQRPTIKKTTSTRSISSRSVAPSG